jgi:hypothetical protein
MFLSPVLGVLLGHLPLISEICLVPHEDPGEKLAAIDNRVVIVPVINALWFGTFNVEGFWVSNIKHEETDALFPDVTGWHRIQSLQTSCIPYRDLDFSPSSNILDVSILDIVNELFLRSLLLIEGFLIDECHHQTSLTDPIVTKHDKVEDMEVVHLCR